MHHTIQSEGQLSVCSPFREREKKEDTANTELKSELGQRERGIRPAHDGCMVEMALPLSLCCACGWASLLLSILALAPRRLAEGAARRLCVRLGSCVGVSPVLLCCVLCYSALGWCGALWPAPSRPLPTACPPLAMYTQHREPAALASACVCDSLPECPNLPCSLRPPRLHTTSPPPPRLFPTTPRQSRGTEGGWGWRVVVAGLVCVKCDACCS